MARFILLIAVAAVAVSHVMASFCSDDSDCVENAQCEDEECQCFGRYVWGAGNFSCYRRPEVAAEVKSDTTLTNFNNETVDFYFPCRYMITNVTTQLKDRNKKVIGKCQVVIFGFNAKVDGKIFAYGMDAAFLLDYDQYITKECSSRVYGVASNTVADYTIRGTDNEFLPNGLWGEDVINYYDPLNGVRVQAYVDEEFNVTKIASKNCGIRAQLRAYDVELKSNQTKVPGISVAVDCSHRPVWNSRDTVLALPPAWQRGLRFADIVIDGLTEAESVLVRAFQSNFVQNSPLENDECKVNPFQACGPLGYIRAKNRCFWMLRRARFIRCIDGKGLSGGKEILALFNRCVEAECENDDATRTSKCQTVKSTVAAAVANCELTGVNDLVSYQNEACS